MSEKQGRQEKIFSLLTKKKNVAMADIVDFFDGFVERKTLQRDIKELIDKKQVSTMGAGRSVSYFISDTNTIFEDIDSEKYFAKPYENREVKETFNFDIFTLLENKVFTDEEEQRLESAHNRFIKNFSRYDSQTLINKEFERIMIEFSWKSSAIEGNTYTLLGTEALLKENISERGKTEKETQMILNHKDAFNESIQNKERFTMLQYLDIEYIHTVLTKRLGITKNIRNLPVGITGTKYKPLDNSFQIKEALDAMIYLINAKHNFIEKAFLTLVLLSYIQAFEDGNKRTARMCANAILLSYGSIPLSYRIVEVGEYKKAALLFYEQNNLSYFKKIFIEQLEDAVKNYFN